MKLWVGIDDTDVLGSPGTNHMARAIIAALAKRARCPLLLRHQLFPDPRVPMTSKNGCASLQLQVVDPSLTLDQVAATARAVLRDRFVVGSDPGLCVAATVPSSVQEFGRRCQTQLCHQAAARQLAQAEGIYLEGLGGTEDGVIGALAAVGLAATQDDGRVVVQGDHPEWEGVAKVQALNERGIRVVELGACRDIVEGDVDLGGKLRPNVVGGEIVLWVHASMTEDDETALWRACRLP